MKTYSFYDAAAGTFIGRTYAGPETDLRTNTPEGCVAMEGEFDRLCQRVDIDSGKVVDWQPPAPSGDPLRTWAWAAAARRWVAQPTLAARKAERIVAVQAAIEKLEAAQARPVREALAALIAGGKPAKDSSDKLSKVVSEVAALQAVRSSMEAAVTFEQLESILWSPP